MAQTSYSLFILVCMFLNAVQLILVNNCRESIWPGLQGGAGHLSPKDRGFRLGEAEEVVINVPDKWSGRIWARQGTSDELPAIVVEMTFGSSSSPLHFYDVSLVDGFNIPVTMSAVGGGVGCGRAVCEVNLNVCCPSALEVKVGGQVVGCKSACLATASPKYCCKGEYANPKT
ncbi:thaumatin-like protein, partial [Tanacetum coccineum]